MNFHELLKNIRNIKKITLRALDNKIKIKHSTLSNFETGKLTPNLTHFIKLCEGLQVTYDELKQLHIEYEKLIKPLETEKLIINFGISSYIVNVLLDNMHFKDDFISIYSLAEEDEPKKFIFLFFLDMVLHLAINMNLNINNFSAEAFYKCIDILKEKSEKLYKFNFIKFKPEEINKKEIINKTKITPFLLTNEDFKKYTNLIVEHIKQASKFRHIRVEDGIIQIYFEPLYEPIKLFDIISDDLETSIKLKSDLLYNIFIEIAKNIKNEKFKQDFFSLSLDHLVKFYNMIKNAFLFDIGFIDYLQKKNKMLENEISSLKAQITKLQSELAKLKSSK